MEKRLGRGLAEIIESSVQPGASLVMVTTDQVRPCRYQPREEIDEASLEELKTSIKRHGIIEPLIVRPIAHGIYELVAGERRWRAAQAIGMQQVPVIVRALNDQETVEYSLVENLQREDLNPIEEAKAFAKLINEFGHTQEQVAEAVGKDRTSVTNALRLLKLPEEIQTGLRAGKITAGHAKALLGAEAASKQLEFFQAILASGLSVRQTELLVSNQQLRPGRRKRANDPDAQALEQQLRQLLGTKVLLLPRRKGGRILIDYFSNEELRRIVRALGLGGES